VAVFVVLATFGERAARSLRQRPSVVDDPIAWGLVRQSVDNDRRVVAIVGSSRVLLAYDAEAFAQAAPGLRGVQLAINAMPASPVLEHLAADESFRGIAVIDLVEWDMASRVPEKDKREWVGPSEALWRAPGAVANRWLAGLAQERLALLALGGRSLLTHLVRGKALEPTLVAAARDRTSKGDYTLAAPSDLEAKAKGRLANFDAPVPNPQDWLAHALEIIEPHVARIRARGGDVLVLRMPTSGRLREAFDKHYPRQEYWDAFARKTSAHAIHFSDVPDMRALECPDEMHLDQTSQRAFTRALVEIMRAEGMFR
jgi:hypothetical protein